MSQLKIETMSKNTTPAQKARQHAEKVAEQFEDIFVQTMVSSLRQSGTCGGEGGMFGSGPGADTYAQWFDQNLSEQLSKSTDIGIKSSLMQSFERSGELTDKAHAVKHSDLANQQVHKALAAIDRAAMNAAGNMPTGGLDVVQ
jgi:Rod binding domain-containing protein